MTTAHKMAKLFTFSERQHQRGRTIEGTAANNRTINRNEKIQSHKCIKYNRIRGVGYNKIEKNRQKAQG